MHSASQASNPGRISALAVTCPALVSLPKIRHGFFTRHGGASAGLYASLNGAYGTGDNPEHVRENYRLVAEALGVKKEYLCKAHQIHSTRVITANQGWEHEKAPEADAIVTATPGLALGVTTADCLPILLADAQNRVVAACHAGWKGALGGIIESTLEAMTQLGAEKEHIIATIGPAIAQGSYEVGPEFHQRFIEQDEANHLYFIHGGRIGHYLFDLKAYAKDRLRNAGLTHINMLAHDTCLQEDEFFSYRRSTLRGEPAYGCQLSAIVLE